jgi:hypothetical protein
VNRGQGVPRRAGGLEHPRAVVERQSWPLRQLHVPDHQAALVAQPDEGPVHGPAVGVLGRERGLRPAAGRLPSGGTAFGRDTRNVYPELTNDRPRILGAIAARAEAHALRCFFLFALLDEAPTMGCVYLEAALAL